MTYHRVHFYRHQYKEERQMAWYNYFIGWDQEVLDRLDDLRRKLNLVLENQDTIMATLDDVLNDVTAESTSLDGIATLISGLRQQLADALAGTTLPAATQAKVDAIFTQAESNASKIAAALAANTPNPAP